MEFQQYLESLATEEKEYASSFFKKKEYIENLNQTAISICNNNIVTGKGNCNSKIAVIVDYHEDLETVIKFIKPMFESINTSLWNVYITCLIKAGDGENTEESNMWIEMMKHEMNAVSPSFIFKFSESNAIVTQKSFKKENITVFNKTFPVVYINLDDVKYVLNKDNFKSERYTQIMNDFYKYVLEIIQYREIEIAE